MGEGRPDSPAVEGLTRRSRRGRHADASVDTSETDGSALLEDDVLDGRTVVIDRGDASERTVVIDRGDANERTVVIDRRAKPNRQPGASDFDPSIADTVIVRPQNGLPEFGPSTGDPVAAPRRRNPAETTPAIYKPRPAPIVPSRPPAVTGGAAPTRDTAAVRSSVMRRDRRTGVVAVTSIAVACVVSVVGLVALVVALLS